MPFHFQGDIFLEKKIFGSKNDFRGDAQKKGVTLTECFPKKYHYFSSPGTTLI